MSTIYTFAQALDRFFDQQEAAHNDPDTHSGHYIRLPRFLELTGGVRPGWLMFVAAKAGVGKTSFLTTHAIDAIVGRIPRSFVYFCLEESVEDITGRIVSALANVSRLKFRDIKLEEKDWTKMREVQTEHGAHLGFIYDDAWTDAEIVQGIGEATKRLGKAPEQVYVDYLQLVQMTGAPNPNENASRASKMLKAIASGRYTGGQRTAVIAALQNNEKDLPLWSNDPLRDADVLVSLRHVLDTFGEVTPDKRTLRVDKARMGTPGSFEVAFFGQRSLVGEFVRSPVNLNQYRP